MTQQTLADTVGVHVTQLRRYEAGTNQPTLDVLRALAVALAVSADDLVFDPDERGPQDESLRLHLAALDQLDPDERASIRALIEGALLRTRPPARTDQLTRYAVGKSSLMARATHDGLSARIRCRTDAGRTPPKSRSAVA